MRVICTVGLIIGENVHDQFNNVYHSNYNEIWVMPKHRDARGLSELDQAKVGQISDDHTHLLGVPNFIGFINAYISDKIWGPSVDDHDHLIILIFGSL